MELSVIEDVIEEIYRRTSSIELVCGTKGDTEQILWFPPPCQTLNTRRWAKNWREREREAFAMLERRGLQGQANIAVVFLWKGTERGEWQGHLG